MFCKKCGFDVTDGEFCPNCGTAVEKEEAQVEAVEETVETTVDINETTVEEIAATDPGKTMGLIALILGIATAVMGLGCTCTCGLCGGSLPLILGIVGIVLSIIGMNSSKKAGFKNSKATIGLILSIVGLVCIVIVTIINFIIGGASGFMSALTQSVSTQNYYY